jgi:uncharacterized low-complexity protein
MKKLLSVAAGTTVIAAMSASPVVSADTNPFGLQEQESSYMQIAEAKCGDGTMEKGKEAKCGDGKENTKEAKCGNSKANASEAKCGEGKCGEGMMKKKSEEGKCGKME